MIPIDGTRLFNYRSKLISLNSISVDNEVISYEFPLNEKVRTLLRLEDLFTRMSHFIEHEHSIGHHAAISTLFEILEVTSRGDLKSDLLQELERQKRNLSALHDNPAISENALDAIIAEIDTASSSLLAMTGKTGQHLRENEWLMSIKLRDNMPGGACEFDLPSYHFWRSQDASLQRENLKAWLAPFLPLHTGLKIILRLLRESGKAFNFIGNKGSFQQMQGGRVAQMLRVRLNEELVCIPEVSANKYAINIRFIVADFASKSTLFEQDVPFELIFCNIAS